MSKYYLYVILNGKEPSFGNDVEQVGKLISPYEVPEVAGSWGTTRIQLYDDKAIWASHVEIEPKDLGKLIENLTTLKSARLEIAQKKYDEHQLEYLMGLPLDILPTSSD